MVVTVSQWRPDYSLLLPNDCEPRSIVTEYNSPRLDSRLTLVLIQSVPQPTLSDHIPAALLIKINPPYICTLSGQHEPKLF